MNRKQRRAKGSSSTKSSGALTGPGLVHQAAIKSAERLLDEGKEKQAIEVYKVILTRDPGNATALYNLGLLLSKCDELEEAAACFSQLLKRSPDDGELLAAFAFLRSEQGKTNEARQLMERAAQFNLPAQVMTRVGGFYSQIGDMTKAGEFFSGAIKKDPECLDAYYNLGVIKNFAPNEPDFLRLLTLAEKNQSCAPEQRIKLEFTMARAFLGQGDTDKAFRHFADANKLKRDTYPRFDIARVEKYADSLIRLFDGDFIKKFRGKGGVNSTRPIFVVGMPRSGSTLVDQILSSHPVVGSVGESQALVKSIPVFPNIEVPGYFPSGDPSITKKLLEEMSPAMLDGIAQKYLSLTSSGDRSHEHVVDKMLFNYIWVGLIRLALPAAKIIHCTRDPVDVGLSNWQLLYTPDIPWTYDLSEIGRYYLSYKKVMNHWEKVLPGEFYEVNYERMVSNQEEETRKLLSYCGLPWDDRCMRFHENKRQVQTASSAQVRRPMYGDSVRKWKKYEKYLTPLIEALEKEETAGSSGP